MNVGTRQSLWSPSSSAPQYAAPLSVPAIEAGRIGSRRVGQMSRHGRGPRIDAVARGQRGASGCSGDHGLR